MDFADLVILILLVSSLARGVDAGSIRQIFSTGGFLVGLFFGALFEPHFINHAHTEQGRTFLTLVITLGCGLILLVVGDLIGGRLKRVIAKYQIDHVDRILGGLVGGASLLLTVWLASNIMVKLPVTGLQNEIRSSFFVSHLDEHLPPAPNVISKISRLIDPNGFPQVFNGVEPTPLNRNTSLPSDSILAPAVHADMASVVKIEGQGCGGIVEGSGFVAAPGIVVTNAHVVAGISNPAVINLNGTALEARVIYFDPDLDLAVLSVTNLSAPALSISTATASDGTPAAVLGYPGGGDFTANAAVILDNFEAEGQNIYNQGNTLRSIYEVKATVVPGNSGGPLISVSGTVIGIVFAQSTAYNQVGYALTMTQPLHELGLAEATSSKSVSTGTCAV